MDTPNVIFLYLGGFVAWVLQTYAAKLGYEPPAGIASALPYAFAVFFAHAWMVWSQSRKALQDHLIKLSQTNPDKFQKILSAVGLSSQTPTLTPLKKPEFEDTWVQSGPSRLEK